MSPKKPRWEGVYDDLRRRIDQGELAVGATIPGEFALAEQHGVSRPTVRAALIRLEQEGILTEGAGRLGRQIRAYNPAVWHLTEWERGDRRDDPARGIDDWAADMLAQGKTPRQSVQVRGVPAPHHVARWLDVPAGTMLIRRRRIRAFNR
jgi:GntR family transcriptional regulator